MWSTGLEVNGVRRITVAGEILGLGSDEVERLGRQVLDDVAATRTCSHFELVSRVFKIVSKIV